MVHLVYCDNAGKKGEKALDKILAGTKTMVVRGAAGRKVPHSRVFEGERLYFMEKGSALITATAIVKSVQNYVKLSDGEITKILGWFLANDDGTPVGWTLFRELKCYLSLELECSGFNDNGVFKLEHKLKDLFDKASEYAKSKGYTTLRTGMSSMDFNIDGMEIADIPDAIHSLKTNRIDYQWLLNYGLEKLSPAIKRYWLTSKQNHGK